MRNNVEMLLDNMMLLIDDLFQNTMIVQMDMELIQHYLTKHQFIRYSNRIIYMYDDFSSNIQNFFFVRISSF